MKVLTGTKTFLVLVIFGTETIVVLADPAKISSAAVISLSPCVNVLNFVSDDCREKLAFNVKCSLLVLAMLSDR